jgi:hypothetical protein
VLLHMGGYYSHCLVVGMGNGPVGVEGNLGLEEDNHRSDLHVEEVVVRHIVLREDMDFESAISTSETTLTRIPDKNLPADMTKHLVADKVREHLHMTEQVEHLDCSLPVGSYPVADHRRNTRLQT